MNLVMGICEGICVLNFGQVIAKGTPEEIQANPAGHRGVSGQARRRRDAWDRAEGRATSMSTMAPSTPSRASPFEVNEGEIVTLIGANGAGKSTILNTVSGLLHSKTGSIEFLGREPIGMCPPHKIVAMGLAQVPGGAAGLPADDGGGEPGNGRLYPARTATSPADS